MLSFHATKKFNTFEGGALVSRDAKLKKRIDYLKNFGFADEVTVVAPGSNGKMNELQAALGLLQLKHIEGNTAKCRRIAETYRKGLSNVSGIRVLNDFEGVEHNYCYFPILVNQKEFGISRDELYYLLREKGIYGRRYFYPLVSDFPPYRGLPSAARGNLPVSHGVCEQVVCLPIYADLSIKNVLEIVEIILSASSAKRSIKKMKSLELTEFST
jgi:dTDP-4-amino-4,6-dideoxygalactose transaminase